MSVHRGSALAEIVSAIDLISLKTVWPVIGSVWRLGPLFLALLLLASVALSILGASAADLSQRTKIVVGSELDYPPYALVTEDGQADGFSVDLMKAVCEAMGIDVQFRVGPWDEVRTALERGEIDALPLVSYSKEREAVFDFTMPHTAAHGAIFKHKGTTDIESVVDLRDKAIIVMRGDAGHDWLVRNDISENLTPTNTVEESLRLLASGKHDYAVAPRLVGLLILRELGLTDIEATGPLIDAYGRGYGFAVKKGNTPLLLHLNEGLSIIRSTGRYDQIYDKWFGIVDPKGVPGKVIVRYMLLGLVVIAVVGGLVLIGIVTLRRTVRRQMVELQMAHDGLELRVEERTQELRDKNFILDAVIEGTGDAIFVKDRDARFLHANRLTASYFASEPEDLVGKSDMDIFPPEIAAETKARDRSVIETGENSDVEEIVHFQGKERTVRTYKTPYRDGNGNVIGVIGIVRDITDRKRAEETLRKQALVWEQMSEGAFVLDNDSRILEINPAAETMFGYSKEEMLGKPPSIFQKEEFVGKTAGEIAEGIRRDGYWFGEIDIIRKDGSIGVVEVHSVARYDEDGNLIGRVSVNRDITERKQAEDDLTTFFDVSSDLMCAANTDGFFTRVNSTCEQMLGWQDSEIVGKPFVDFIHPDDVDSTLQAIELQISGEPVKKFVNRYRCKDGSYRWLEWVATPALGKTVFAIARDITERLRAEEEARRFSHTLENSLNEIYMFDSESLLFVEVNAAAQTNLGYTIEELRRLTPLDIEPEITPERFASLVEPLRACAEEKVVFTTSHRRKDGTLYPAEIHLQLMAEPNPIFLAMILDISERSAMERQLLQAQKMEVVGQLTGGVAHDFNNLLQVVQGNLEIAKDTIPEGSKAEKLVDGALHAGRRGAKLTQQLLAFSRQQTLSPENLDAHSLVDGMTALLSRTLGEDISVETEHADDVANVIVDENGLTNALLNLGINARAAMPKGGTLTMAVGNRHMDTDTQIENDVLPAGDYIEIAVTDTGCGISEENLYHAFEPFFTTKEVGEGSGLGLSMVYGFVRQSGGNATIESELGKGTTVRLVLPATGSETVSTNSEQPAQKDVKHAIKVLLIEDDADVRATTLDILQSLGCDVVEAKNAAPVPIILEQDQSIDLLISDVVLTGAQNGIELAQEAVRLRPALKVILVSGYSEGTLEKAGLTDAGFPLLAKPFSKSALSEALESAMR